LSSATLPGDLIVEAEALGAAIDFRADMAEAMWPLAAEPLFATSADVAIPPGDFAQRGRIPLIGEALRQLRQRVGDEIVIGAWIAGPFTLAMQVVDYHALLPEVKHSPGAVGRALDLVTDVLIATARAYHAAGADFITIHEMGGSPGVVGPHAFGELILPRLKRLIAALPTPTILSVCGNTNQAVELLAEAGASALNLDQTNNLARTRALLGDDILLFGNLDPVGVIAQGNAETIRAAVQRVVDAGVDAVMPGCDLFLQTPEENLRALVEITATLRRQT
jgi:[methyl-Co(III) methanol-specific corrinoid protein]:coenzyme M methyltransferase